MMNNKKKIIILALLALVFLLIIIIPKKENHNKHKIENIKVEFPSDKIDPEKIWRNYFEEKLIENRDIADNQITDTQKIFKEDIGKLQYDNQNKIDNLRSDFSKSYSDLNNKIEDIIQLHRKDFEESKIDINPENISITNIKDESEINNMPFDRRKYIPETSYVTGILVGGIAVSTSIGSASAPVPVLIRINDRGNLPKNFITNLTDCRILGSSYGDLSSERAVIRAESLVCTEKDEITITKIAGIIYGDDGMNGIKGRVIDMSSKHLKNAAIGSMISAFGNTIKNEADLSITPYGAIARKGRSTSQNIRENSFKGAGNAAEKIAEYYIKQAENMSPVLQIPGGTKVDVVFTKGVYLGSTNVLDQINSEKR